MKSFPSSILSADEVYTSAERLDQVLASTLPDDVFVSSVRPVLRSHIDELAQGQPERAYRSAGRKG